MSMPNFANEKTFDEGLERIGDLYEKGKDALNGLVLLKEDHDLRAELYYILSELRNIAAVNLKANHEIKDN